MARRNPAQPSAARDGEWGKNSPKAGRRAVLAGAAATAFLPAIARAGTNAGSNAATALRLHDHSTHTRLVIELAEAVDFKILKLAEPYRLLLDLPPLTWAVADRSVAATGLVANVQYVQPAADKGRVTIDLAGPVNVARAFILPPTATTPTRLVLDMEPTSRESFLAAVQADPAARPGKVAGKAKPEGKAVAKVEPPRRKLVAIDPGHGGIDPGTIGLSGIYEKNITLAAAQQLKARLEYNGRYRVVLTRNADDSLALRHRAEIAREASADLFISLHADANPIPSVRGLSVYTLSEKASDAEAEALAAHENQADGIIGMDLSHETAEVRNILVDLAQRESRNLATKLATRLIGELQREVLLLPNTHRFAGFAVLKAPDIPSVLIEMGYLSNREDEKALRKEAYRAKLIAAVVRGVDAYFVPGSPLAAVGTGSG